MFFEVQVPEELESLTLPKLNPANAEIAIREAERFLDYTPGYIPMSFYMEYRRTGNRTHYESLYHEKRRALGALLIGEIQEGKGRFLDKAIDVLYSILQETSWCIPAHYLYKRDSRTLMLPNTRRPVIDLFSAETAATLSVAYNVLKPILTEPDYRYLFELIEDEIDDRIVKPYINDHFWWMGDGTSFINNWAPWCTMNMMLTFFLMPVDNVKRRKAFRQACYTIDHFLKDYGIDGCCNEGAGYYHHAGLCMMNALMIMDEVSDGSVSFAFEDERIRNIAAYIMDMHVTGDWYINYEDCSAKPGRCGIREYLAGKVTHNEKLMAFAKKEWEQSNLREQYYMDGFSLYFRFLAHSYDSELEDSPNRSFPRHDVYYKSNGVVVAERGRYVFAVKGGDNGDSHNHNDVSSIILYKDGKPVLIDIGVEEYTALTFSERRYEIWTMKSIYHQTLNFGDIEQKPGKEYSAENMTVDFGRDVRVSMDVEKAFGDERVRSYERNLCFGDYGLVISENADTDLERVLTIMTAEPVIDNGGVLAIGKSAKVGFSIVPTEVETEEFPIDDTKLNVAWGKGSKLYRTRIHFDRDFTWNVI